MGFEFPNILSGYDELETLIPFDKSQNEREMYIRRRKQRRMGRRDRDTYRSKSDFSSLSRKIDKTEKTQINKQQDDTSKSQYERSQGP